jgi:hypothetical protein
LISGAGDFVTLEVDTNIFYVSSTDGGTTWSIPTRPTADAGLILIAVSNWAAGDAAAAVACASRQDGRPNNDGLRSSARMAARRFPDERGYSGRNFRAPGPTTAIK